MTPKTTTLALTLPLALPLTLALALASAGCHYSNPHGSQALAPIKRLDTDPPGAKVRLVDQNIELEAPCDLPDTVGDSDELEISKTGYMPWRGQLYQLTQSAMKTYRCVLQPVAPK